MLETKKGMKIPLFHKIPHFHKLMPHKPRELGGGEMTDSKVIS
jgi:hypothetical protein